MFDRLEDLLVRLEEILSELQEPDVEIELDEYRSYNRSKRSGLQTSK